MSTPISAVSAKPNAFPISGVRKRLVPKSLSQGFAWDTLGHAWDANNSILFSLKINHLTHFWDTWDNLGIRKAIWDDLLLFLRTAVLSQARPPFTVDLAIAGH